MLAPRAAVRSGCLRGAAAQLPRLRSCYHNLIQSKFLKVSEEVRDAVATGKPVVALETTIYTHGKHPSVSLGMNHLHLNRGSPSLSHSGFPYPDNIALASLLESVVRANGGVPATVGILGGMARVGLSADELSELASMAEKKTTLKVSRRDLGYICGLVGPLLQLLEIELSFH